jgi:hypothetical protein
MATGSQNCDGLSAERIVASFTGYSWFRYQKGPWRDGEHRPTTMLLKRLRGSKERDTTALNLRRTELDMPLSPFGRANSVGELHFLADFRRD